MTIRKRAAEIKPLTVNAEEAATMLGIGVTKFRSGVKEGIFPGPVPGTNRYSIKAIENYINGGDAEQEVDPYMARLRVSK